MVWRAVGESSKFFKWNPHPLSWQDRILESVPSGIDVHQLERFLKLTPTERLEEMRQLVENAEALRGNQLSGRPQQLQYTRTTRKSQPRGSARFMQ
jgi:hypothetical protein